MVFHRREINTRRRVQATDLEIHYDIDSHRLSQVRADVIRIIFLPSTTAAAAGADVTLLIPFITKHVCRNLY